MKKTLIFITMLLAGCVAQHPSDCVKKRASDNCEYISKPEDRPVVGYAIEVKSAIEEHFYAANSFKGRACTLIFTLEKSGTLTDIAAQGGDAALCSAAIVASRKAKFPPMTDEQYKVFHHAVIDFKL
ncbi:TPA: cell envelope integrity TolA C-terminal domain-containing protein [Klebsiella pneumoniae]|jgi:TolA protein